MFCACDVPRMHTTVLGQNGIAILHVRVVLNYWRDRFRCKLHLTNPSTSDFSRNMNEAKSSLLFWIVPEEVQTHLPPVQRSHGLIASRLYTHAALQQ